MTLAEIEAAVRAEYPDPPGFPRALAGVLTYETGAAYETAITDLAALRFATQERQAVVATLGTRRKTLRAARTRLEGNVTKLRANAVKLKDKVAFDAMTAVVKAENLRLAQIDSTESAADVTDAFLKLVEILKDQGVFQPEDDQP